MVLTIALLATLTYFHFNPELVLEAAMTFERGRAGLTAHSVQIDGHRVAYWEGGQGPSFVFVHGFGGDKDNWTRMARFFSDRFHVVALDLPGFGESSRIETASYDIPSQIARLKTFHEKLNLGRIHIAGNSRGGQIATHFAAQFTNEVTALFLIDPKGATSPIPSEFDNLVAKGTHPLIIDEPEQFNGLLDWVFVNKPFIPSAVADYFANTAVANGEFRRKIYADQIRTPAPVEPILSAIRAPTLIVWGDQDRIIHPSSAEVFRTGITNAKFILMENCGHSPQLERPEELAGHILDFLKP